MMGVCTRGAHNNEAEVGCLPIFLRQVVRLQAAYERLPLANVKDWLCDIQGGGIRPTAILLIGLFCNTVATQSLLLINA